MLFEPLFKHAASVPHEISVIDESGRHSYQQLAAMSAGLERDLGMQTVSAAGDRLLYLTTDAEFAHLGSLHPRVPAPRASRLLTSID